jgi:hypothetical protein
MESVNSDIYTLSDIVIDFVRRSNVDLNKISESNMLENISINKINPFINLYAIQDIDSPYTENICIKDVIGWDTSKNENTLFKVIGDCYSDEFGTYHTRDNDKLRLNKDEMINDLKNSFSKEEIRIQNIEDKYVVTINGFHRTSILRLLYLDEISKDEANIEEINQKYTIRAMIDKYDMTLTYINFFMQRLDSKNHVRVEYGKNYLPTGKYTINDNKDIALTKEELINHFAELVKNNEEKFDLSGLDHYCKYPSFKEFAKTFFPVLVKEDQYGSLN